MSKSPIHYAFHKASATSIMSAKESVADGVDRKLAFLVHYKCVMMGYILALLEFGVIDKLTYQQFKQEITTLYNIYIR